MVRAPPCHGGGRRFEPDPGRSYNSSHPRMVAVIYFYKKIQAGVAELADARDLKSREW